MSHGVDRENEIILSAMEALTSALTSNVRALTLEFDAEDEVTAHFVLRGPSPEDEQEILEEFPTELSVLTNSPESGDVLAKPVLHFDGEQPTPMPPGRIVFAFRP